MKLLSVLIIVMVFYGCENKTNERKFHTQTVPVDFIRKTKLSDLIENDVSLLPLQSENTPLIGEVSKLEIRDFGIYVLDNLYLKGILRFGDHGEFLTTIGRYGEAQAEYSNPRDFTISKKNIEVFDKRKNAILKYNFDGLFINEYRIPFSVYEMEYESPNRRWIYTAEDGPDFIADQTLYLLDSTYTEVEQSFFPYTNGLDDVPFPNYLIKVQDGIRFTRPLVGEFFSLKVHSGIDSLLHADYSPYNWSLTEDELSMDQERTEGEFYRGGVMSIAHQLCETSKYLVFRGFKVDKGEQRERLNKDEDLWLCIYHKKADKLLAVKEVINDIDSTLFALPIYTHDDDFYGVLYPEELLQNHPSKVITDGMTTIAVDSLSMEQNPILVKYRFNDKLFYQ